MDPSPANCASRSICRDCPLSKCCCNKLLAPWGLAKARSHAPFCSQGREKANPEGKGPAQCAMDYIANVSIQPSFVSFLLWTHFDLVLSPAIVQLLLSFNLDLITLDCCQCRLPFSIQLLCKYSPVPNQTYFCTVSCVTNAVGHQKTPCPVTIPGYCFRCYSCAGVICILSSRPNARLKGLSLPLPIYHCEHLDRLLTQNSNSSPSSFSGILPIFLCRRYCNPLSTHKTLVLGYTLLPSFSRTSSMTISSTTSSTTLSPWQDKLEGTGGRRERCFLRLNSSAQKYVVKSRLLPRHSRLFLTVEVC